MELHRHLDVSYKAAWSMKHKVMQVMYEREQSKPLSGFIELDDAYIGGQRSGGKAGRGAAGKTPFVAIGILVPIILFLSTNAWLYGTSRLIYSLSRKNFLPFFPLKKTSGGNIPRLILLSMLAAYSITFFLYSFFSLTIHDLVFLYSFGSYIVFLLVFLSGILIFKSWKKITAATVFILFSVLLLRLEFKIELAALFVITCFVISLFSRKGNVVHD